MKKTKLADRIVNSILDSKMVVVIIFVMLLLKLFIL